MNCPSCSQAIPADSAFCPVCGHAITPAVGAAPQSPTSSAAPAPKSRVTSGVLGILLGGLGIHKFYLSYTKEGLIMLLVAIVGGIITAGITAWVMGLIGLIEGIVYLTKSNDEFSRLYVQGKQAWF